MFPLRYNRKRLALSAGFVLIFLLMLVALYFLSSGAAGEVLPLEKSLTTQPHLSTQPHFSLQNQHTQPPKNASSVQVTQNSLVRMDIFSIPKRALAIAFFFFFVLLVFAFIMVFTLQQQQQEELTVTEEDPVERQTDPFEEEEENNEHNSWILLMAIAFLILLGIVISILLLRRRNRKPQTKRMDVKNIIAKYGENGANEENIAKIPGSGQLKSNKVSIEDILIEGHCSEQEHQERVLDETEKDKDGKGPEEKDLVRTLDTSSEEDDKVPPGEARAEEDEVVDVEVDTIPKDKEDDKVPVDEQDDIVPVDEQDKVPVDEQDDKERKGQKHDSILAPTKAPSARFATPKGTVVSNLVSSFRKIPHNAPDNVKHVDGLKSKSGPKGLKRDDSGNHAAPKDGPKRKESEVFAHPDVALMHNDEMRLALNWDGNVLRRNPLSVRRAKSTTKSDDNHS